MGKRGTKPQGKVKLKWSSNFAYAIGLLATDGCLSKNERHIDLTSKEEEQLKNFCKALGVKSTIGYKNKKLKNEGLRVQVGDVNFYKFLQSIGLTQRKSLTMGKILVSDRLYFDFLRGCFDGDGTSYSYYDKRWKSSFMIYIGFASGSKNFINWLRETNFRLAGIKGHVTKATKIHINYSLRYAKTESFILYKKMFYSNKIISLRRKRLKLEKAFAMIPKSRLEKSTLVIR